MEIYNSVKGTGPIIVHPICNQQVYKLEKEIKDLEESGSVFKNCDYEAEKHQTKETWQ